MATKAVPRQLRHATGKISDIFAIARLCENLDRWRTIALSDEPDRNVTCPH